MFSEALGSLILNLIKAVSYFITLKIIKSYKNEVIGYFYWTESYKKQGVAIGKCCSAVIINIMLAPKGILLLKNSIVKKAYWTELFSIKCQVNGAAIRLTFYCNAHFIAACAGCTCQER